MNGFTHDGTSSSRGFGTSGGQENPPIAVQEPPMHGDSLWWASCKALVGLPGLADHTTSCRSARPPSGSASRLQAPQRRDLIARDGQGFSATTCAVVHRALRWTARRKAIAVMVGLGSSTSYMAGLVMSVQVVPSICSSPRASSTAMLILDPPLSQRDQRHRVHPDDDGSSLSDPYRHHRAPSLLDRSQPAAERRK